MLSNLFSSVLSAIASFFTWLWDCVSGFFGSIWKVVWNTINGLFWDFYALVVNWFCNAVAYLFPMDEIDFDDQTDLIVQQIAAWDTLLPIHETFYILSLLWSYWVARSSVGIALRGIRIVKKLMPF